jgi:hypothetical protein
MPVKLEDYKYGEVLHKLKGLLTGSFNFFGCCWQDGHLQVVKRVSMGKAEGPSILATHILMLIVSFLSEGHSLPASL